MSDAELAALAKRVEQHDELLGKLVELLGVVDGVLDGVLKQLEAKGK